MSDVVRNDIAFASIRAGVLIELAGDGDQRAFAELYESTAGAILDLVRANYSGPVNSEEIAERIFLDVWASAPQFTRGGESPLTWLSAIARVHTGGHGS